MNWVCSGPAALAQLPTAPPGQPIPGAPERLTHHQVPSLLQKLTRLPGLTWASPAPRSRCDYGGREMSRGAQAKRRHSSHPAPQDCPCSPAWPTLQPQRCAGNQDPSRKAAAPSPRGFNVPFPAPEALPTHLVALPGPSKHLLLEALRPSQTGQGSPGPYTLHEHSSHCGAPSPPVGGCQSLGALKGGARTWFPGAK